MTRIKLGKVAGLELSAKPSAIGGLILLWVLLSVVAALLFRVPLGGAVVGGLHRRVALCLGDRAQSGSRLGRPPNGLSDDRRTAVWGAWHLPLSTG